MRPRPIGEDTPNDGRRVLLWYGRRFGWQIGQWDDSDGFPPSFVAPQPTHWAELPEDPE